MKSSSQSYTVLTHRPPHIHLYKLPNASCFQCLSSTLHRLLRWNEENKAIPSSGEQDPVAVHPEFMGISCFRTFCRGTLPGTPTPAEIVTPADDREVEFKTLA
jgi:hypothetical protein